MSLRITIIIFVVGLMVLFQSLDILFAQEVELEIRHTPHDDPFPSYPTEDLQYKVIEKPEGVTAPDGNLQWGKLTLGKFDYIACVVMEDGKPALMLLDRDRDNDLEEEQAVEVKKYRSRLCFPVDKIPAEFQIREKTVKLEMNLTLDHAYGGLLFSCTGYRGKIKVGEYSYTIQWVPSNRPTIEPASANFFGLPYIYRGRKKLHVKESGIMVKGNKVLASLELSDEQDLIAVDAPEGLICVVLVWSGPPRSYGYFWTDGKKVYLRKGIHMACGLYFSKEYKGDIYILNISQTTDKFEVKENMKLKAPEPCIVAPSINQEKGKVKIGVSVMDVFKRQVSISKSGKDMPPPRLKITNPAGREVATHEFQPG